MMRSLFSAVSGLKAHQTKMDVIGNNIANVNTVAYKSQSVTFNDVYYQTTQTASGPNSESGKGGTNAKQIGLGSSVASISTAVSSQGATERTDNAWDLCIAGDCFFVVSNAGETYFTRAGDFKVDVDGALVTSGGAAVLGWVTDPDTNEIIRDKVQPIYVQSPEYTYTAPAATTGVTIKGNIDASSTGSSAFTYNFFDSLGNEYQATMTVAFDSNNSDATKSTYTITQGTVTKNGEKTNLIVNAGSDLVFNKNTGASYDANASVKLTFSTQNPTTGTFVDCSNDLANIGTADGTSRVLTMDASGITMYNSATDLTNDVGIVKDGVKTGAGKAVGVMTSVGVNESGQIVASYNNGDTKIIGQIAVTSFPNPAGLEKVGENLYAATLNSGAFDGIGQDITESGGKMTSGYLEMSNVDLSDQFTTMITTQRGFQANSRIITVSDTMLEELINLKR